MSESNHKQDILILFAVLLAVFIVPSSISGTAIALPYINADIKSDLTTLQWVVNAFNLTFACFTLVWGKISDVFGRKRSFLIGALIYTLASIGSALSLTAIWLDVFRAMAGIGGAAIFSCGSAIFVHTFEGKIRTKAFALFGTVAGLGITLGPTISGVLLDYLNWQAIFFMHAVGLFMALMVGLHVPSDKPIQGSIRQVDILGACLFITSMFLLMVTLSKGYDWGKDSPFTLLCLGGTAVAFVLFITRVRVAPYPLLNLDLLKNNRFLGFILVPVVASFTFVSLLTYFPTYLTGSKQLSASEAGLIMLFLTAPVLFFPLIAGKLAAKGINTKFLMYLSMVFMLAGGAALIVFVQEGRSIFNIAIALVLIGIGMGLAAGLVDGEALSCIDEREVGMAAGLLNTFRLGSEAIAVAIYGSLLSSMVSAMVRMQFEQDITVELINTISSGNFEEFELDSPSLNQATIIYDHAFVTTNIVLTVVALCFALLAALYLRKRDDT